jgi:hypothetical protein
MRLDMASAPRQRKMLSIDADVLRAVNDYSRDSGERLDNIYDQALRDFLKKMDQPVGLKEAFAQSARQTAANDRAPTKRAVKNQH